MGFFAIIGIIAVIFIIALIVLGFVYNVASGAFKLLFGIIGLVIIFFALKGCFGG